MRQPQKILTITYQLLHLSSQSREANHWFGGLETRGINGAAEYNRLFGNNDGIYINGPAEPDGESASTNSIEVTSETVGLLLHKVLSG